MSEPAPSSALLSDFARINDALVKTPSILQKRKIIADYLQSIASDDDLRRSIRYLAGTPFRTTTEQTMQVGGATVYDAAAALLKIDSAAFSQAITRAGEMGEAVAAFWNRDAPADRSPLTLHDLADAFDELSRTGHSDTKRRLVFDLLSRAASARESAYILKIIFGDLRTGVRHGVLISAIADAFNRPADAVRHAQLLIGDLDELAVLARNDNLASARFQLFHPIQFMLATPQEDADIATATMDGRPFIAEQKLDGIRAQVHKAGNRIAIYTRTMDRTDESFPDIVERLARLPGDWLLDGEIIPWRAGHILPFAHIQKRLGRKKLTPKVLNDNPCIFVAFDLLYLNGEFLLDAPLHRRRERLEQFPGAAPFNGNTTPRFPYTAATVVQSADDINAAFLLARDQRTEGLVLKDPDSPYSPGRRGKAWLKLKTHLPTLDCVVTAAEYGHGKRKNLLSDYTFAVWDRDPTDPAAALVNIGKAYSGVTDEEISQLTKLFHELSIATNGHVHTVQPKVVLEIACDQIQQSTRHASGYAMRFPRIKRIRWDKPPQDADRLDHVNELYHSAANFGQSATAVFPAEPTLFDNL